MCDGRKQYKEKATSSVNRGLNCAFFNFCLLLCSNVLFFTRSAVYWAWNEARIFWCMHQMLTLCKRQKVVRRPEEKSFENCATSSPLHTHMHTHRNLPYTLSRRTIQSIGVHAERCEVGTIENSVLVFSSSRRYHHHHILTTSNHPLQAKSYLGSRACFAWRCISLKACFAGWTESIYAFNFFSFS